jgi:signal transduction histidine kinase
MPPRTSAKVAFASAVILLLLCGLIALSMIKRYATSAQWVNHTYDVKVATGKVESTLSEAARDRLSYINTNDAGYRQAYQQAKQQVSADLQSIRDLTVDNPAQQERFQRLSGLINRRVGLLEMSVDRQAAGRQDTALQTSVSLENTSLATTIGNLIDEMQGAEDQLLTTRKKESSKLIVFTVFIFGLLLASAILLLWLYYRLLNQELSKREEAESGARRLSVQVLELQDEERRRFARELHDGLGQNLAVAKMMAVTVAAKYPEVPSVPELVDLLERTIQETRTISHLLHPPMLDDLGLASAAGWYLDEFSNRSGLKISASIPAQMGRLPRTVELVLFRVLQESLTNVHRHSKSPSAEVALQVTGGHAILQVRDFGVGIPPEKLGKFLSDGTRVGVGLSGMRERVREHGGQFDIRPVQPGTELRVTIPLQDGSTGQGRPSPAAAN